MKTFSLKNLWVRLGVIVLASSFVSVLPMFLYSYEQYEKMKLYKVERNCEKILSVLSRLSHLSYSSVKGEKIKHAEIRRTSRELISLSKNIAKSGKQVAPVNRTTKMLYSASTIESFIRNPSSGDLVSDIGLHVSQQSAFHSDKNMCSHILMDVSSSIFPHLYSDVFKLSDGLKKYSAQGEKVQVQSLMIRSISLEQNIRELSNELRKVCSLSEPTKTVVIIGNITKLNSTLSEFNSVMSKLWSGKVFDNKQAELVLASIESVANTLWNSTNGLLVDTLNERIDDFSLQLKISITIFFGVLLLILIFVFFVLRSIVLNARLECKFVELIAESKFSQLREMADNSPCKIEPFAETMQNVLRVADVLEQTQKSSTELVKSVEKLNSDASDVVAYQKPLVLGVASGLTRTDAKIVMRDKSDVALASSAQSICDKLGVLEQTVRLQSKSISDVSSEIEQASKHATKLIASLSSIRETANKMSLIAETFTALADQANILGLNLAIETAKAGIKGSGLGTLAEQIKILSKRTVISVIDIESVRDLIVDSIDNGSDDAKKFLSSLEADSKILEEIGGELSDLTASLSKVSSASNSISVSLRERGASDMSLQDAQENLAKIEESLSKFADFTKKAEQELSRLRQR